jgi:beta-glucanase (GH16 family)
VIYPNLPLKQRTLILDQDFSKLNDVDESVWIFNDGPVHNNELQTYTTKKDGNIFFQDDALVIEARKEGGVITSGRLMSVNAWQYGVVEVVAKVPKGKGTWPAIWMLPESIRESDLSKRLTWPRCGEIDIVEHVGFDPLNYHFTIHSEKYNHMKETQLGAVVPVEEEEHQFHTFMLDWRPESIEMRMDGQRTYFIEKTEDTQEAWPFDCPYFVVLNLAIGGDWGGKFGVDEDIFPTRFMIKSVRFYQ